MTKKRKTMIGIVCAASACAVCAALFFYVSTTGITASRLIFIETTWGEGGVDDKAPAREIEVKEGRVIHSSAAGYEEITFEIKEISRDSVVIQTNRPMSLRKFESDGIDLNAKETEFIVKKDSAIFLNTPTMDGGAAYKIVLK
ncbi:MAG: hypothetical protein HFJ85_00070 [Oscillospiraceae bacterium]|nr:hypothetical protein [Oscillospiraceae bacterium]